MDRERISALLISEEGLRLKPYHCSEGKLTLGVGRNIEDFGISKEEALHLLENDINRCLQELRNFAFFAGLDQVRQEVVLSMIFNLGAARFAGFSKMLKALEVGNYRTASIEMLDSRWAKQVGARAVNLAMRMATGLAENATAGDT